MAGDFFFSFHIPAETLKSVANVLILGAVFEKAQATCRPDAVIAGT